MAMSFHLLVRSRLKYPALCRMGIRGRLYIRGQARKGYRNCKKMDCTSNLSRRSLSQSPGETSAESIKLELMTLLFDGYLDLGL
jgi:hypothetical protein